MVVADPQPAKAGADASAELVAGGTFQVNGQDFQIVGGSFKLGAGSDFVSGVLPTGTSLLVRAPLVCSEEINPFTGLVEPHQGFVEVELGGGGISSIAPGGLA